MRHRRTITHAAAALVALALVLAPASPRQLSAQTLIASHDTSSPDELHAVRTGTNADVPPAIAPWHGTLAGKDGGAVSMTIVRVGSPEDASDPVWPVVTRWQVTSADPAKSFSAELFGGAAASARMGVKVAQRCVEVFHAGVAAHPDAAHRPALVPGVSELAMAA